ncbi:hypothetical protein QBC38DRAFT_215945 [Podospora fimiseda]|uniref:Uncharacterized protein n=1 Tax=Podospora fimiseda TaxID=252190 RepID=A0AAN7BNY2_9PEZI|nr:hypothetical protein QBC38DRAFT_215945 [Podospora fimiseda]
MSPRPGLYSTFKSIAGEVENKDSPLTPFLDASATSFWTSDQIKDSASCFGIRLSRNLKLEVRDGPTQLKRSLGKLSFFFFSKNLGGASSTLPSLQGSQFSLGPA